MQVQIRDLFGSVRVEEPIGSNGLVVFPMNLPSDSEPTYVLLEELLAQNLAEITEVSEAGSVPTLAVHNRSDRDALILDGTELHGAKQDRMVNLTIIIEKQSHTTIPVSCVEQGRWSYKGRGFASSGRTVASRLRSAKSESVLMNLKMSGAARSDQGRVWSDVSEYLRKTGTRSGSDALADVFARRQQDIEAVSAQLKDIDACGAVVGLNGRIEGLDLLTHRPTFKKLWAGLLRGYAIDAVLEKGAPAGSVDRRMVLEWLERVAGTAQLTQHKVPGIGEYYACESDEVSGGIVTHMGKTVHVVLFPVRRPARADRGAA